MKHHPELAKAIQNGGHEIGNHSYNHPDMSKLTRERISEQLRMTNEQIEETLGVKRNGSPRRAAASAKRLWIRLTRWGWERSCGQLIRSIGRNRSRPSYSNGY